MSKYKCVSRNPIVRIVHKGRVLVDAKRGEVVEMPEEALRHLQEGQFEKVADTDDAPAPDENEGGFSLADGDEDGDSEDGGERSEEG